MIVIVLPLVDGPKPDYVFGQTRCSGCRQWCWIDEDTIGPVVSGRATPMCVPCGEEVPVARERTTALG